jgi:uncharacterized phage-associated protein
MAKAIEVAKYITDIIDITQLKLQKLLYYTQAVCLVRYNKPAFEEIIEAWDYGPVVPEIYRKFRQTKKIIKITPEVRVPRDPDILLSADMVIGYYGRMDAPALIRETHSEAPWREAYIEGENRPITNEAIKKYYQTVFIFNQEQ